ncbi:MAG: DNA polymerase III subunit alpha [Candidatus Peribacteraceae bacterium]
MKSSDFVHLHCHSTFSLLEGLPTPEEIVERAVELGQSAVGLTDKGYTYGLIEFYKAAKSQGIKPILGLETYVAARTRHDKDGSSDTKRYPLVLLAENDQGYRNLLELATKAAMEGMYYKPRVDAEILKQYGKGLIALTGPISGAIPQAALAEDAERVKMLLSLYREWFGSDNVYFELMDLPNVPGQAEVNQQLIKLAKDLSVPLVASSNSHYCRADDAEAHDVLLCIQKNNNVQDASRFTMRDSDFSMRPFEELEPLFSHVPEALENTRVIADRCSVSIAFGDYRIPKFPVAQGQTEESLLREQTEVGIRTKYAQALTDPAKSTVIMDRMNYELGVIEKMGFSGYFLIVADFIAEAKRRGITVGPGRGSAAGSIVSFALDITTLDPLEHGLLFERFLNPERISMPDIDIDFADTRRDEVLEYVRGKYGADRVIQICTFGTLAARAAVKDVGRVYGVSFAEMNALAKLIPDRPGTTLAEALETEELQDALKTNDMYRKILEIAVKLEGKARHVSVHACGVVITPEPAVHYTALQHAPKSEGTVITQYHAKPLEALGLLKMDFLGLKNLTIIQTALLIIERLHGKKIDMAQIPIDDKVTFDLLSRGETTGVFQLESGGMRRYLKQLKPTQFEDITAMVSLYRPGPMEKIPEYIKCKHGQKEVSYPHPDLEPILKPTYGVGIYQEQILEMARVFAGYTLGEADLLRRAIGKKIKKELDAQRDMFIKGSVKKGYTEKLAVTLFDDVITPFANYGFNKSHGACYARIAYETAYLKAHYPTEFMAALLSSEQGDTDRIAIEIDEARSMGLQVLPPDINESLANFTALPDGRIRFGLLAIKGVGESSIRQVIEIREQHGKFSTIEDFASRVPSKILNKKLLESLAKAGALDCLGDRATFIEQYEKIVDFSKAASGVSASQTDMFASLDVKDTSVGIEFDPVEPLSSAVKLKHEKEALGLYVSSHPLAGLKKYIGKKARLIETLNKDDVGRKVTVAGMVETIKNLRTKKGEGMAVVTIEDPTGRMEAMFFPKYYSKFKDVLEDDGSMLVIAGTLDMRLGVPQLKAEAVKRASLDTMIKKAKETGMFSEEEASGWRTPRKIVEDTEESPVEDIPPPSEVTNTILGPLASWIQKGMKTDEPIHALHFDENPATPIISIHTIDLPARAPKALLLAVKDAFETFPGSEKVQLKIGEKIVDVSMTVTMSPLLEKRIDEAVKEFGGG